MLDFKEAEIKKLNGLGFTPEDYMMLSDRLTVDEFDSIGDIAIDEELVKMAQILNERNDLPERYEELVDNYNGFEGIQKAYEDIYY